MSKRKFVERLEMDIIAERLLVLKQEREQWEELLRLNRKDLGFVFYCECKIMDIMKAVGILEWEINMLCIKTPL